MNHPADASAVGDSEGGNATLRIVKRALIAFIVAIVAFYATDYLWLRFRMATNRNAFGSVTRNVYYSVKLKNGKTEYSYGGQQDFECPNTVLPQYWERPCWLAKRKKDQQIDIDSGNPHNPSLY
jgi:hypothetical protein